MSILVTGGAGFIGSHTVVELLNAGKEVVIVDNFVNSKPVVLDRIREITGKDFKFYNADLCDMSALEVVFKSEKIDSAIHFAGLKAVGESCQIPLRYYQNNLISTLNLCELMAKYDCKNIVFSSSATVYGKPASVPIREDFPNSATNPYGETKLMIEHILKDLYKADAGWNTAILRYFNPIGAHSSGKIGEDPSGIPNNLMPYITQVAIGKRECLSVYGNDYATHDGTGVRDYIHVVDLAKAHLAALNWLEKKPGLDVFNIGTGHGYSVLDIVKAYESANGIKINYKIADRRPGDIDECYADPTKAREVLGWEAKFGIEDMCRDSAHWQQLNPNGYDA
ncbi:MAG: UDP-glucose 4-epimerase GalE [Clostridiales bacterium]|nr:UDP-glucose 4-epimerase GalE [Clostridiales bacterium]